MRKKFEVLHNKFGREDLEKQSTLLKSTADKQEKVQIRIDKMEAKIDELYDFAMKNGAYGGKILGAGAGGFLLFYIK